MKKPRNFRALASKEKRIARSVFKDSIPYSKVFVSDGLGYNNRPFTLPEAMGSGYILFVGNGYYGMSFDMDDMRLLIHELTHVWQAEHSGWRWNYVFRSAWHQAGGDAYKYDPDNLKRWTSYNPEQQASIVEHWFRDGASTSDPRFKYIRFWIRGNRSINIKLPDSPIPTVSRVASVGMEGLRRIPSDLLFGFDSARLKPRGKQYLKSAGKMLSKYAKGRTVVIEGHTDSIGSHGYNRKLSQKRARAVKRALIEIGVDNAKDFDLKAYGEAKPIASNATPQGRQKNRRVEFSYR